MNTTPNRIEEIFRRIAPRYDRLNRVLSWKRDVRWRERAIAALSLPAEAHVLDLCAGTMDMAVLLLRRYTQVKILCADFCEPMLKIGREKIPHVFHPQVETLCCDAQDLPCADASFDAVLCAFGMRNIPDQHRALAQVARVLKPGGQFVILEFFPPTTKLASLFANTYVRFVIPYLGGFLAKDRAAYQHLRDSTAAFYPLPAYRALLRQFGFHITHETPCSGGIATLLIATLHGEAASDQGTVS